MKTNYSTVILASFLLMPVVGCGDDGDGDEGESDASASSTGEPGTTSTTSSGSTSSTSSEEASGGEQSSSGADPFADCQREVLEPDFGVVDPMGVPGPPRWYGPGADPETGALLDDGQSTYVVSATYIALRPEAQEEFFALSAGNSQALFGNPGMVASQLGFSFQCAAGRTFTVWEDEDALMAFVGSEAHLASIAAFSRVSRGGSTLSVWEGRTPASAITWDAALERMASEQSYD